MLDDFDVPPSKLLLLLFRDRWVSHQILQLILLLFFLSQPILAKKPFLARLLLLYEGGRV